MSGVARSKAAFGLSLALLLLLGVWVGLGWERWPSAWAHNRAFLALNSASVTTGAAANQRAADRLEEAVRRAPGSPSLWRALGYTRLALGQPDAAIAAWQAAPGISTELIANGGRAEAANRLDEALSWYRRATVVAPQDVEGWLALGQVYENRGDWPAAAQTYEAGIAAQTGAAQANGDLYFRLARVRANLAFPVDYGAVLDAADRAIQTDRFQHEWSQIQSHFYRGVALDELGHDREAMAEFAYVVERLPDEYWPLVRLGRLTWELDGNSATAERHLRAALRVYADDKWAYLALAEIYWNTERRDEALELYRTVLRLDPHDPTAAGRLEER